jgi:protease I
VLIAANVLKGRKITCYSAVRPDVEIAGATYVEGSNEDAVVDGNLVTGQDWIGHVNVIKELLKLLGSRIEA